MIRKFLNTCQHRLADWPLAVRCAVYARNQCNSIIKFSFVHGAGFDESGERWLLDELAPNSAVMVDVGANVGEWTRYARDKGCSRIVAFEPSASALARLTSDFRDDSAVTICPVALSDEIGTSIFAEQPNAGRTSSFVGSFSGSDAKRREVAVSTLDHELETLGIEHADVLKIDCEGFDYRVLCGARGLLERGAVGAVQFEYNQPWREAGSTLAAAMRLLTTCGYDVYMLRRDGLYVFDYDRYGEFFDYSNFVALGPAARQLLARHLRGRV